MQHRRRLQIFQAAKRAAFTHQQQAVNKKPFTQSESNKLVTLFTVVESYHQV